MKIAILGLGSRGNLYANIIAKTEMDCEIVAVCDTKKEKCRYAVEAFGVKENMVFDSDVDFFAQGKLADILVLSTMDELHYEQAMKALTIGYDILLEKPISPKESECREIIDLAAKLNRKIAICHVLRYSPFYREIKARIDKGEIGDVITISETENVAYWHQAHSFVRGNWRNSKETSPMILQKCCHDLDIIRWLMDSRCVSISSFGSLEHYTKKNRPEGAADRCVVCKYKKDCLYSAEKYYIDHWKEMGCTQTWPWEVITNDRPFTEESLRESLKASPWGRCVYACDNDVVDHQIVNMSFENGAVAQLNMIAFSEKNYRRIHIWGTKGEIIGDMDENWVDIITFGKGTERINLNESMSNLSGYVGHGGGDFVMIHDFFEICKNGGTVLSSAQASLESHLMAFAAEKSRLNNGEVVNIKLGSEL